MGVSIDIADLKGNALQIKAQKDIVNPNQITLTSEEVEKMMSLEKLTKDKKEDKNHSTDESPAE